MAVILLVAFPVHEFAHALVAYRLGDDTAQQMGRLTLNPLRHLDIFGSLMLIVTQFIGWAKPVPVNPYRLRYGPRVGNAIVAAAGPLSNLLMAIIVAIPYRLGAVRCCASVGLRCDLDLRHDQRRALHLQLDPAGPTGWL